MAAPAAVSASASASAASSAGLDVSSANCLRVGLSSGAPSAESVDYVSTKGQFQLHSLLTEQRHPATFNLSQDIARSAEEGLRQLLKVDEDITAKIDAILAAPAELDTIRRLQAAMLRSMRTGRKIYFYGCGATGRLAKLMESGFWRPFWARVRSSALWPRIEAALPPAIGESLIGEMTGADRALISSLEGFEDLLLIGELQLADRGIERGDTVIAVTEGGETSSVIGTVLAALKQWDAVGTDDQQAKEHLFFVYNNPDSVLLPFARSASVLNEPRISKMNLSTGPQAITGSTRMQATSVETFVLAVALHCALDSLLRDTVGLDGGEMHSLGFSAAPATLEAKLSEFGRSILPAVVSSLPALARFTALEASTYSASAFSCYMAQAALMTVFIDSTERSPTFRLFALDPVPADESVTERKCWIKVLSPAKSIDDAWELFLGRPFRGLESARYLPRFQSDIADEYLRSTALRSLPNSGADQAGLYDFSSSQANLARRGGVRPGDLGVLVLMGAGEVEQLRDSASAFAIFAHSFLGSGVGAHKDTKLAVLVFTASPAEGSVDSVRGILGSQGLALERAEIVAVYNGVSGSGSGGGAEENDDPLGIRPQMAMKLALNAHSTGVMARLGKVLGNCMVNVNPGNLKLVGRATFLIQSHVNSAAEKAKLPTVSYALANAVLYDSVYLLRAELAKLAAAGGALPVTGAGGQSAEVSLSVVRILASLAGDKPLSGDEALVLLRQKGLEKFLDEFAAQHSK